MTLAEEASSVQNVIIECVDECLKELGESVRKVIYFHLERSFGINRNEIPVQPEAFCQAMRSIFGQGAIVIERLIMRKIRERFKLYSNPESSLIETFQAIMKNSSKEFGTKTREA